MVTARVANQEHDYPMLENQPESVINKTRSWISIDNSSVRVTRNGEPNNLYPYLARETGTDKESRKESPLPQRFCMPGRSR